MNDNPHQAWLRPLQYFFLLVAMPVTVALTWQEALNFNPYDTILTKGGQVPTARGLLIAGWFFVGLGALLAFEMWRTRGKPDGKGGSAAMTCWVALMLALFGAAVIKAGNEAERMFAQEGKHETR